MKRFRHACVIFTFIGVALCASTFAQTSAAPAFEVASIKAAPSMQSLIADLQSGKRNIAALQTTMDGARVDIGYLPLTNWLAMAYKVKPYQISGPDWLGSQAFEIHAKMPEGGSKEQIPEMMQALLKERFKLVAHHENPEKPIYALIVSKDGLKLKEAVEEPAPATPAEDSAKASEKKAGPDKKELLSVNTPEGQVKIKQESQGIAISGGKLGNMRMTLSPSGTAMLLEASKLTMPDLIDQILAPFADHPILDKTELKGAYQISLEIPLEEVMGLARKLAPSLGLPTPAGGAAGLAGSAPGTLDASDPAGNGIMKAIEKLGLKLDSQKAPIDMIVVDSIEKSPTED